MTEPAELPDHAGPKGAHKLKARLEDYWWSRGYAVDFELKHVGRLVSSRTDIRSNLINGLPPDTFPVRANANFQTEERK